MSEVKKRVPKLRFPGFVEEWKEWKLSDIVSRITLASEQEGIPRIEYEDIISGRGELNKDIFLKKSLKKGIAFEKQDILFGKLRPYLKNWLFPEYTGIAVGDFWVLRPKESDNKFIYFLIQCDKFQMVANLSAGTKMPRSDWKLVSNTDFNIPINIEEQAKIGLFFVQLNDLITLQQRKLEHLQEQKKGLLQKMFPKDGEKFPELRFSEFTGTWEQRKLGESVQIIMGQSPNSKNYTDNSDDHILVQGNADMKNGQVFPRVWTTQVTKKAEKGDLILSVRAPVGDIGKTDYDVVLGRGVAGIKGDEFIFQVLGKMKQNNFWNKVSTGSTFESINSNDIKDALFMIPCNEEKAKIGSFFAKLDDLTTLHQRKLNHLKDRKKALLQQLFV
jgi:type I restriction enzyme S subunit